MAATDTVTPSREILRVGDVSYRRSVSEAVFTRVAAQNNFINSYQTDIKEWKLNGLYSVATDITFYDGVASFFYNSEIVGVNFYNGQKGVSGITTFDIHWKNASGVNQGSIFSVTPKINSSALDESIGFRNLVTGLNIAPAGVTAPTFSKTSFSQGESVFFKITSSMISAQNCGISIFYRPIN